MGPKALIVLVGLGVGGMFVLGLLAAYAVEQNPDLKAIVLLKTALARELEGDGLAEVSVRRLPGRGGHLIRAGFATAKVPERIEARVADVYATHFPHARSESFDLVVESAAARWGCESPRALLKTRVQLRPYYEAKADLSARELLEHELAASGLWAIDLLQRDGFDLHVRLRAVGAIEAVEGAGEDLLRALEAKVRTAFRGRPYRQLHLELEAPDRVLGGPPELVPSGEPTPAPAPGSPPSTAPPAPTTPRDPGASAPTPGDGAGRAPPSGPRPLEGTYDFQGREAR